MLLAAIVLIAGVLSAFLVNDAICLVLTPLVIELVRRLRRDPVPYLLAIAMASNVGSTATITGNPQNMIIGGLSQIPYADFAAALAPVAGIGLVLTVVLIALCLARANSLVARDRLGGARRCARASAADRQVRAIAGDAGRWWRFFAGVAAGKAAIVGGGAAAASRGGSKSEKVYAEIDWTLLLMFAGLFM